MKKLENKTEKFTQITDGAGILQNGTYLMSKEEVEKMALRNVAIIPYKGMVIVINSTDKKIIAEGNYLATPDEVKKMILKRIKYQ